MMYPTLAGMCLAFATGPGSKGIFIVQVAEAAAFGLSLYFSLLWLKDPKQ